MLIISTKIELKLATKHNVNREEVEQCISNLDENDRLFEDDREGNQTIPPTFWFISETDNGRKLKVVVVPKNGDLYLKTAYEANNAELKLYARLNNQFMKNDYELEV